MKHYIKVILNNGEVITFAVKRNPKLVEALIYQIREVIQKLRKSICKMVDTYCWTKAVYMVGDHEEAVITAI